MERLFSILLLILLKGRASDKQNLQYQVEELAINIFLKVGELT